MSSLRPLILSALASVAAGLIFASVLGGPASIMFIALGPIMVGVTIIDRVVEKRAAARTQLAEVARELSAHPSPELRVEAMRQMDERPVTWWSLDLEPPQRRTVRLGERSLPARDLVAWGGRSLVRQVVVAELDGGLEIVGPAALTRAVELALRVNRACVYGPHESVPVIAFGDAVPDNVPLRWRVEVDAFGRGRLRDRLSADAHPLFFDVDMLDESEALSVAQWEAPLTVTSLAELRVEGGAAHTLVSGMTGSGKTEFLVSWLWHLASTATPDELAFAIIDFKGGGSFARLRILPHVRHIATDIAPVTLTAALSGIRSQILQREKIMAQFEVADIAQVPEALRPPRFVLVIDEYHALIERYTDFRGLLSDIAARGRALGLHLVVSSQSFSSHSHDSLLANIHTRVVFRASDAAESSLLLGAAHESITRLVTGSALVLDAAGQVRHFQVPMVALERTAPQHIGVYRPLWLEPLRAESILPPHSQGTLVLGSMDDHGNLQRIDVRWEPLRDGVLLCVGASHVSRRSVMDRIRAADRQIQLVPDEPARAWDFLEGAAAHLQPFVIPDLDSLIARTQTQWREELMEMIIEAAHRLSSRGLPVAVGVVGEGSLLARMRHLPSTELSLSGDGHSARWGDREMVLSQAIENHGSGRAPEPDALPALSDDLPLLVITATPTRWKHRTAPGKMTAVTPHEYLMGSRPRDVHERLIIDGCSPAEFRALRLSEHPLPPPLHGTVLELDREGRLRRLAFER